MLQNELKPKVKAKKAMRVWRWGASWKWRTCWRWDKWQNSRKSGWVKPWFEWWQTPLYRRLPKLKGFTTRFKVSYQVVNVWDLNDFDWKKVDLTVLLAKWLISKANVPCKILWTWDLNAKITLSINKISQVAQKKIEKAWGTVELIK